MMDILELNKNYTIKNGYLTTMLRVEGGVSKTNNSLTDAYYNAKPSQLYTFSVTPKEFRDSMAALTKAPTTTMRWQERKWLPTSTLSQNPQA